MWASTQPNCFLCQRDTSWRAIQHPSLSLDDDDGEIHTACARLRLLLKL